MGGRDTAATRELRALEPSLGRAFVRLTDRVFVAAGYGMSTFAFVLGDTGVVAVDAGSTPEATAEAIAELRRHCDLPIAGIVYTHHHFDHIFGAAAVADENPAVEIWAVEPFGNETLQLACVGTAALRRALGQFGHLLPPELHVGTGFASASAARSFRIDELPDPRVAPTRRFSGSATVRLGGVTLEVSHNPGETDDQALVWFEAERVAFVGDNMYR